MNVTIADVLHRAADHWLAVDPEDLDARRHFEKFSCVAVMAAVKEVEGKWHSILEGRILEGLEAMGCDTNAGNGFEKLGYPFKLTKETQGARYMWLKFAALIAEEQGV